MAYCAYYDVQHQEDYRLQDEMDDHVSFLVRSMGDIIYFHQATKAPDRRKFSEAIVKELNSHIENKHWEMIHKDEVSIGEKVIDSVWAMRRKEIRSRMRYISGRQG